MSRIYLLFILIGLNQSLSSQDFVGQVQDAATSDPIAYASIYITELSSGVSADSTGSFLLKDFPRGVVHFQISRIGYQAAIVEVDLSEEISKTFFLSQGDIALEEVVISGPSTKLQAQNIVGIERRTLQDLQQSAPITLAAAISDISGVSQNTTGAGIGKPVIRGLSGNRIVTYAQGIRIENQQWGEEHGLGVGDVGIESVEVIKGPSSLLYGSDALGGVLFFIDERYAEANTSTGFLKSQYSSNTSGFRQQAGIKINTGRFKTNIFGTYASHADYKVPNLGRVENTRFDEKNLKIALGYNYKNWISHLRYSILNNGYGLVDEPNYIDEVVREPQLPSQDITNHNLSFQNKFFIGSQQLHATLGYTFNDRKEYEESLDEAALDMDLSTFTFDLKWQTGDIHDTWSMIYGVQGLHQSNKNSGEEMLIPDATTQDIGAYTIANYNLEKLQLQGGVRIDRRRIKADDLGRPLLSSFDATYNSLNFSLGGVYQLENVTLRANLSSGFRSPNTSELLADGIHEGTNRYERGNIALKSEKALQFDFTVDYQDPHLRLTFNPFYKKINNYIFLTPTDLILDDAPVYDYMQTNADLYGGEIGVHFHPHEVHWLHLESNLAIVYANDTEGNPLPLIPAHNIKSRIRAEFEHHAKVYLDQAFINHSYAFDQSRIGLFESNTAGYHLLDLGAVIQFETKREPIQLNLSVNNLFNTSYIDHLSRFKEDGIPNQGMNVVVGLNLAF